MTTAIGTSEAVSTSDLEMETSKVDTFLKKIVFNNEMIINISLSSFFLGFFGFLEVTGSLSILESPWIWRSINENLIDNWSSGFWTCWIIQKKTLYGIP
ncbi:hypothetical protein RhiirC2_776322 [Rhizophagus irregularis]|uniref:Uncharacterized protein n=1 Tax=Rhizophagus irregularis TaxID=588596 RepID=A0A2N1NH40_9GLOM|nr:hypothetical protein RhiirC2_776322 [Rhizophagus irregularis]